MAEIEVIIIERDKYNPPERNITKVLLVQINTPQAEGEAWVMKIKINIIGTANNENIFHILNTFSEKKIVNNNEAEINNGIIIEVGINSLKKNVLQV